MGWLGDPVSKSHSLIVPRFQFSSFLDLEPKTQVVLDKCSARFRVGSAKNSIRTVQHWTELWGIWDAVSDRNPAYLGRQTGW